MPPVSTEAKATKVTGTFTAYRDRQAHAKSQIARLVGTGILEIEGWGAVNRALRKGHEVVLICPGGSSDYQQVAQRLRNDGQCSGCSQVA